MRECWPKRDQLFVGGLRRGPRTASDSHDVAVWPSLLPGFPRRALYGSEVSRTFLFRSCCHWPAFGVVTFDLSDLCPTEYCDSSALSYRCCIGIQLPKCLLSRSRSHLSSPCYGCLFSIFLALSVCAPHAMEMHVMVLVLVLGPPPLLPTRLRSSQQLEVP